MSTITAPRDVRPGEGRDERARAEPSRVRVEPVTVSAWHPHFSVEWLHAHLGHTRAEVRDGYIKLDCPDLDELAELLEEWQAMGAPVWLELGLADDPDHWFEGIADPWKSTPTPEIDWSGVEPGLRALRLIPRTVAKIDGGSTPQERLVALSPHTYALGVARIRREVLGRDALTAADGEDGLLFFPTVGFRWEDDELWTIRMCVMVVETTVITIRLPDLLCTGIRGDDPRHRSGVAELGLPRRFLAGRFPQLGSGPVAADIAETIAIHHAATARAVAETARDQLRDVEVEAGLAESTTEAPPPGQRRSALHKLEQLAEMANRIDRQLARELRRLADYGEREEAVAAHARVRYGFALDEIRSLRRELSTARAAIVGDIQAKDQHDHEKFQFIAALIGSAILVPTLVATIYGANVARPGRNTGSGLAALLLFVATFAVLGVVATTALWANDWRPREWWPRAKPGMWAALGLLLAALALVIALVY